jgi:pteridine reductase
MMTMSLAKELAPHVRVNGIAPGAILWPNQSSKVSDDYKQSTLAKIPAERLGNASEIAETALFLANGPGYITGQIIAVDGGRTLYS